MQAGDLQSIEEDDHIFFKTRRRVTLAGVCVVYDIRSL